MQYSLSRLAVLGQQSAEQHDAHVLTLLEAPLNVGAVLASEKECDRRILLAAVPIQTANAALHSRPARKPRRQPVNVADSTPF